MKSFPRVVLIAVVCVLLGVLATFAVLQAQPGTFTAVGSAVAAQPEQTASPSAAAARPAAQQVLDEGVFVDIYERVSPAVVNITSNIALVQNLPGGEGVPAGTGSGFLIDEKGYVLTNNHVVEDARSLDVTFADGTTVNGTVLGRDPASDLAVVKVDIPADLLQSGKVAVAKLGDSDQLRVGQLAIAIGNPFGFERTMTVGIVSGLSRDIPSSGQFAIRGGIQTDAAINPGNSGGPLLNVAGEVIGINSSIESPVRGSVGVGFAVPVNTAKRYLDDLIAGRPVEHPYLGIEGYPVTQRLAEQLDLPVSKGVYVVRVTPDGPAQQAGLKGAVTSTRGMPSELPPGGDVITAVDGREVTSASNIGEYLEMKKKVGDKIQLTVRRGSEELTLEATLAARPSE